MARLTNARWIGGLLMAVLLNAVGHGIGWPGVSGTAYSAELNGATALPGALSSMSIGRSSSGRVA